jgi:hypothetical protein
MPAVPGPPRPGTGSGDHQVRQAMDTPSLPLPTRHSLAGVHYREFRTEGAYSSSPRPQGSAFLNPGKTVTLRSPRKLCTQALMRFGRICLHLSCSLRFTRCYNVAKHPDSRSGLRFPQAAHALRCLGGGSGTLGTTRFALVTGNIRKSVANQFVGATGAGARLAVNPFRPVPSFTFPG